MTPDQCLRINATCGERHPSFVSNRAVLVIGVRTLGFQKL
jgi:hypothetical protein